MADSTAYPPGSRAIKIPLYSHDSYTTPIRRRRSGRYIKTLDPVDTSDAGPSSSVGSDQDSSLWSSSSYRHPASGTTASPSTKDPRLPSHPLTVSTTPPDSSTRKDKQKAMATPPPNTLPFHHRASTSPLGPSMLSSSSYKSINLASHSHDNEDDFNSDEPPRLITYTKHSQGFTWNDELFLPTYLLNRYGLGGSRGRKKRYDADFGDEEMCPVTEIFVSDEEARAMMP